MFAFFRFSLSAILVSAACSVQAADLWAVYQDARQTDPIFSSAKASYLAGQEKKAQGLGGLLPQVSVSFDRSNVNSDNQFLNNTHSSGAGIRRTYTVSAKQALFRADLYARYRQGVDQTTLADIQYQSAQQTLILRVTQAYFDVLLAQDRLSFVQAQKSAVSRQLEFAKASFKVGMSTVVDSHEAQARYDAIVATEINAVNDLELKRHAFLQLTQLDPTQLAPLNLKRLQLYAPQPATLQPWLEAAREKSLEVLAQEKTVAIAEQEVKASQAGHLPTVDLIGTQTSTQNDQPLATFSSGVEHSKSRTVGVQIAIPLFSGGVTQSKVREAQANLQKAQMDLEDTRRRSVQTARTAFLGVSTGIAQIKALEQALQSALSVLESTKIGVQVGVRTSLDLLNAEQTVFSAKRDLAEARYTYLMAQLKLKAAVQKLNESDVQMLNQWMQS